MGIKEHDWRTKDQVYVPEDTQLGDPERYEWGEPPGVDQRIITRGIARKGARLEVVSCQTEIEMDGGERLQVSIKEVEPTAIFLNESRLAWQRRQRILSDEEGIIRGTGRFSTDEREFDFLQASQTAVIMAIAGVGCYANIKISQLRKGGRPNEETRKGAKLARRQKLNLEKKIDEALPQMTKRGQPSKSTNIKGFLERLREHQRPQKRTDSRNCQRNGSDDDKSTGVGKHLGQNVTDLVPVRNGNKTHRVL